MDAIIVSCGRFDFHARFVIRDGAALWFALRFLIGQAQLCRHLGNRDFVCLQGQLKPINAF